MSAHQGLILIDASIDITQPESIYAAFAARTAARDGVPNLDEALGATHLVGGIAQLLVESFASTTGYRAVGTRDYEGMGVVLIASSKPCAAWKTLFSMVNSYFGTSWAVVGYQTQEIVDTGQTQLVDETDEQGNVVGQIEVPIYGPRVDVPVPLSLLPWIQPSVDDEGNEIPVTAFWPGCIGGFQGAADWVYET